MNFAIVGAGFTGAVLAQELAKAGHTISVFESRNHIAGNCYSERDEKTGVMLHQYTIFSIPTTKLFGIM